MNNPINLIKGMMGKLSPKQMVMNMIGNSNPVMKNLVEMANKGQTEELMNFGRNLYKERGLNFDEEFSNFMSNFK